MSGPRILTSGAWCAAAFYVALSTVAQPAPAPAVAAPKPSPNAPADETTLLTEILKELRGLRLDVRALAARDAAAARPQPPAPSVPASLELGVGMMSGSDRASVAIVEFSEYQCPFCKRHHDQTFPGLKEQYVDTGKVRYEFRHFPLAMHAQARPAAVASTCAGRLGAFWKAHEELFKQQSRLGPGLFEELPATVGVDPAKFKSCLADPQADAEITKSLAAAEALGVGSTPHFFVGRIQGTRLVDIKVLKGAQPLDSFKQALDALLPPAM